MKEQRLLKHVVTTNASSKPIQIGSLTLEYLGCIGLLCLFFLTSWIAWIWPSWVRMGHPTVAHRAMSRRNHGGARAGMDVGPPFSSIAL